MLTDKRLSGRRRARRNRDVCKQLSELDNEPRKKRSQFLPFLGLAAGQPGFWQHVQGGFSKAPVICSPERWIVGGAAGVALAVAKPNSSFE